ncbi:hypothetical protein [Falsirhodobacter xinxiangensis]|uniref:hypothetical protein n=1 Tax=Falsirhodobacter xinxiangensis TaxID=2530049 RepID=UPI0010AA506A|nr:hypothetical protein [Rhodobacter xinxiangensis]
MMTPTQHARAFLDMIKAHHPDADSSTSDAELLDHVMADVLLLADGLAVDAGHLIRRAEAEVRRDSDLNGPVIWGSFVEPPAIAAE